MPHRQRVVLLLRLLILLLLAGCASHLSMPAPAKWVAPIGAPDYSVRGPHAVVRSPSKEVVVNINADVEPVPCRGNVETFTSARFETDVVVIFAHGFLSGTKQHIGMAEHFASWGLPVLLVGHCGGGWSLGGQRLFAELVSAAADRSGRKKIIYAGFSAGGGVAWSLAQQDPRAIGYLGLDPVGKQSLATSSQRAAIPHFALFAPSAGCNAKQLGRDLLAGVSEQKTLEIAGASHCHFEAPTSLLCRTACREYADSAVNAALRTEIFAKSVAVLRWVSGLDQRLAYW